MDIFNAIRAVIFLVAGLVVIIFYKRLIRFQVRFINKHNLKIKPDSKKAVMILGISFFCISGVLFVFALL